MQFGGVDYTLESTPGIRELNLSYPANESAALLAIDWWSPSEYKEHTFSTLLIGMVWILVVLVVMALSFVAVWSVCFAIDRLAVQPHDDEKVMVTIESRVTAPSTSVMVTIDSRVTASSTSEVQRP